MLTDLLSGVLNLVQIVFGLQMPPIPTPTLQEKGQTPFMIKLIKQAGPKAKRNTNSVVSITEKGGRMMQW